MKVAIVSGGTKGIGRAICENLLHNGCKVYLTARNKDPHFVHKNLVQFEVDMSKKKAIKAITDEILKQEEIIDILVNNVGVFIPGKLMEEPEGSFETQLDTNLASTYHLTRYTIEALKKSTKPYIFNICSTASKTPYLSGGSYCVSKYAQLGLTHVLRQELKSDNIKVSAILPGATLTNSWSGTDLPKERFSDPESIAQLLWSAYTLPDSTVIEEITLRPLSGDI